ncbi:MAG TPA: D-alanine--D-alanine ligase family protein [Steroidobacteraceae bacterium]|nr:D-alanine--D-alanine ligase family protein [Steroidobacteraceae bacterium]
MQTIKPRLRVGVLFGGRSAEHEISILSARNVLAALDPELFEPVPIAITRDGRWLLQSSERLLREKGDPRAVQIDTSGRDVTLIDRAAGAAAKESAPHLDVIVPIVHGSMGEDGTLQGVLEMSGIPYVGAGVLGSAVGMDKDVMKRLLNEAGLPVARFRTVRHYDYARNPSLVLQALSALPFPLFVKPANLGSSVGITKVVGRSQLQAALDLAFTYDTKIVVEEGVDGREVECGVLGNDEPVASIPGEIVVNHADGFYSYDAKYIDDGAQLRIPASLSAEQVREVQRLSIAAFRVLECSGLARVDFFLRSNGEWVINEINTLPGFTAISMYPKLWAASGVQPRELITRLIDLALTRHVKRKTLRTVPSVRQPARQASVAR